jgi:hypothetical protein
MRDFASSNTLWGLSSKNCEKKTRHSPGCRSCLRVWCGSCSAEVQVDEPEEVPIKIDTQDEEQRREQE